MAKGHIGTGIVCPDIWAMLPMMATLLITAQGLADINWDLGLAWQLCLKNPMFGGDVPVVTPLPLWTYMTGHWLVGILPISTIVFLTILAFQEWKLTSGPREDVRGFFETVVSLLGSAPMIAWCWKQFLEGNAGKFYYNIDEYSYTWLFVSLTFQLFCLETWFYWTHRISHMKIPYNFMHRHHHSYVPTISSCAAAFHPLDMAFLTAGCFIGPMLVPQFYPMTHFMLLVQMIWTIVAHVPCRADFRKYTFGYGIISDPNLHNIHHDYGMKPANMGSMLCLWDHFGGTYYPDPPVWADVTPEHAQYEEHQKRRKAARPEELTQDEGREGAESKKGA